MSHTSAPAQTAPLGTMSLESIKFGKDLPGYEYGPKQGPALIVIQVRMTAKCLRARQAATALPENHSAEQAWITTCRSGGESRMRSRRRRWSLPSRAGVRLGCPATSTISVWHPRSLRAAFRSMACLCARYRVLVPDLYKGKLGVTQEEAHHVRTLVVWAQQCLALTVFRLLLG